MGLLCSTQWTALLSPMSSAMHQPALPLNLFHGLIASSKKLLILQSQCSNDLMQFCVL